MAGMEIEISGVDAVIREMEDLREAISPDTLKKWADLIQQTVDRECGEGITFKGLIDSQGQFKLETNSTAQNMDCLIDSIRKNTESMHPVTKAFYEKVIYKLIDERAKRMAVQSGPASSQ